MLVNEVLLSLFFLVTVCPENGLAANYAKTADGEIPKPVVAVKNVCAWPNLTMLGDGTIAAVIFNRPNHGASEGDVDVWTSGDQGKTWQLAGTAAPHDPNTNRMNVSVGLAPNGDLLVIASGWSNDPPSKFRSGILNPWLCRSSDGGKTWTIDKTAVPKVSPRGYPVIPYGDIIAGPNGSLKTIVYDYKRTSPRHIYVISSHDGGYTWGDFVLIDHKNNRNETTLLNLGGDDWLAVARSGTSNWGMYSYFSSDKGASWQPRGQITGGNRHPGHLMRLKDGKILLTYGNRNAKPSKGIDAMFSEDGGLTWSDPIRVVDFVGPDGGYPSSVQLSNGYVLTAYYAEAIDGYNQYHMGVVTWDPAKSFSGIPKRNSNGSSNDSASEKLSNKDLDAISAQNNVRSTPSDNRAKPTTFEELRQLRKKAVKRRRRIIYDNDGNDALYECENATPEDLLKCRTTPLVGTHVDTIFYCTNACFGLFWHDTKLGEVLTSKKKSLSNNKVQEFLAQGLCPLRIMVDYCHKNNMEIFWSMRINDIHDSVDKAWFGPIFFPQIKKDHPEYLVSSREHKAKIGGWTAVDYSHKDIRNLALQYVQEVCENYDVDGVSLDFFRHLVFFKSVAMGGEASSEELEEMTNLLGRIRRMTTEAGLKRGRPILVAVRVPDSVDYCKSIGLDIVRWMKEDLIDLMIPGGDFRLNPWSKSIDLGHKYGIPVYPCLCRYQKGESMSFWRGRAMNAWWAGANGIYTFNLFDPHLSLWSEMGEVDVLQTLERSYSVSAVPVHIADRYVKNGSRFGDRPVLMRQRPMRLQPGESCSIGIEVGERIPARNSTATTPKYTLRLLVDKSVTPKDIIVRANDQQSVLADGKAVVAAGIMKRYKLAWLEYRLNHQLLREGTNLVEVKVQPESKAPVRLSGIRVHVSI